MQALGRSKKPVQENFDFFQETHGKKKSYHALCRYLVKLGAKPFHQVFCYSHNSVFNDSPHYNDGHFYVLIDLK